MAQKRDKHVTITDIILRWRKASVSYPQTLSATIKRLVLQHDH